MNQSRRAFSRALSLGALGATIPAVGESGQSHVDGDTPTSVYNVKERIPEAGKSILITGQIQALIDECSEQGGGYIYFPAGEYLTGSLILRDNTFLYLTPGATLFGSTEISHYTEAAGNSLIYAGGSSNFGIMGQGTINGNGDFFWRGKERPYDRPDRFLLFEDCRDIRISGITFLNSPNWNLELRRCDFAWIDGVSMICEMDAPNTDGIDPVSSSHVFISNCYFELGDDAICPKSHGTRPTEFVVVENCVIKSDDSAIKLGTGSEAPIRNLVFNNIIIKDTQYGIALFAKDGGTFENIRFSNITIESARTEDGRTDRPRGSYPIFADIERRRPDSPLSAINDIHFSNITINSHDGHCLFLGQPDRPIEGLHFSDITFRLERHRAFEGNKKPRGNRSLTDRAANDYSHIPSNFTFAHVDGLHIEGLNIQDVDDSGDMERHMVWGYDVHHVLVRGFSNRLRHANNELSQINLRDVSDVEISSSRPTTTSAPFLSLEGAATSGVILMNNNFGKLDRIVGARSEVSDTALTEFNNLRK
jgi:hypothetical protein